KLNGIATTSELRIRASAVHAVQLSTHDGHVYLPLEECIYTMIDILNEPSITSDFLKEQISHLSTEKNLILVEDKVYLPSRSEEHTSKLQSRFDLVCRLLLEKKKNN